jgi:hypothetical protein
MMKRDKVPRETKDKWISIRIQPSLYDEITALAAAQDRTVSAQILRMIREGLERVQP